MAVKRKPKAGIGPRNFRVGYRAGVSGKIQEIEVRGMDSLSDEDASATNHGQRLWSIIDEHGRTIFQIPQSSLIFCVADAYIVKKRAALAVPKSAISKVIALKQA